MKINPMKKSKKSNYKPKWEAGLEHDYSDAEIKCLADEMLEWITYSDDENKNSNFWLNDFAAEKMLVPAQLNAFALKCEYFNTIFGICKAIQESKLLKMALYKEVNATPAVFILKSIIGTGDNEKPTDMETAKKQVEEIFEQ